MKDPTCPACDSDVPVENAGKRPEEVHCPYCGMPLRVELKEDIWEVEEDY